MIAEKTRKAWAEYRQADDALQQHSAAEKAAGVTEETPDFVMLNEQAALKAEALPFWLRFVVG